MVKIIITGGDGFGKTSVAKGLEDLGFKTYYEVAREFIRNSFVPDLKNEDNYLNWNRLVAGAQVLHYFDSDKYKDSVFDLGIVDNLGFIRFYGYKVPDDLIELSKKYRYDIVFSMQELPIVLSPDPVRIHTPEQSRKILRFLEDIYEEFRYSVIKVPPITPVQDRIKFITRKLGSPRL